MENEERRKRARRTTLDQLEEGRIYPILETTEGESNEAETSSSSGDDDEDDLFEYSDEEFLHSGGGVQFGWTEDEGDEYSYDYYEGLVEEDDVDPDELSYEELIALGEMVGVESRGLSESDMNKHLRPLTCESTVDLIIDRCVICQIEYEGGEKLVALNCDHPYHNDCIRQWLHIKKICPICNNEVATATTSKEKGNPIVNN